MKFNIFHNLIYTFMVLLLYFTTNIEASKSHFKGQVISVWNVYTNPYYNPSERYPVHKYPACPLERRNNEFITSGRSFGEVLTGAQFELDSTKLHYLKDEIEPVKQCEMKLANWQLRRLYLASYDNYITRFMVDDLTVAVTTLSVTDEAKAIKLTPVIYTQRNWVIYFNKKDQITDIHVNAANPVILPDYRALNSSDTFNYEMTYTVRWVLSEHQAEREDMYKDAEFFHSGSHVFSLFNGFFLALFLIGLVVMIFHYNVQRDSSSSTRKRRISHQVAKKKEHSDDDIDVDRKSDEAIIEEGVQKGDDNDDMDLGGDSGWKQINNDVFRPPRFLPLFSALVGSGWQLFGIIVTVLLLPNLGLGNYFDQGSLISSCVFMYLIYSLFGGFKSSQVLNHFSGKEWIRTMSLQGLLFPVVIISCWTLMLIIHSIYGSLGTPGFGIYSLIIVLLIVVVLPLTLIGTLAQRRAGEDSDDKIEPSSTFPGIIPPKPWYFSNFFLVFATGLPAGGVICTELYYIASAYSTYWWYYTYGFALLMLIIMVVIVASTAILITFLLLNTEDYRWQWNSFLGGCSVGVYAFLFFHIFYLISRMYGPVQFISYHTMAFLLSSAISLICGTASYTASSIFVHTLYRLGKMD